MPVDSRLDHEPLDATRAGEGSAFGVLYSRHQAVVLAFLGRRTRDAEVAADLLAETFAAALIVALDPARELPREPVAWLMTIARNKLTDGIRRGRVEKDARERLAMQPLVLDGDALTRIENVIDQTDVALTLAAALPPDQFEALRARVLDEQEYAEIAGALRCSEAVVRKRVSRALQTLRAAIEGFR